MGSSHYYRYKEIVREVQFAEEMDFDFWGSSEQHNLSPTASISSPSILYGYLAAKTSRIKFFNQIVLTPHKMNHPIRIAEDAATLDIVSDGRFILGLGRGNNPYAFNSFEVDPKHVRSEMFESIEIIGKAFSQPYFEHQGESLTIPRMTLTPRPYTQPHPPMLMVGTSNEANRFAGEMGIGIINTDNWIGWEDLEYKCSEYLSAIKNPTRPASDHITNRMVKFVPTACCAETREEAKELAAPIALSFLTAVAKFTYGQLAHKSKDYAYMAETGEKLERVIKNKDIDELIAHTPSVLIGTPDDFIERGKRLEAMGYTDVSLRLEGFGHEKVLKSMELIGKYVIPEFKPNSQAQISFDEHTRLL